MGSQMSTHHHLSDVTERMTKLDARMHEVRRLRELVRKAQRYVEERGRSFAETERALGGGEQPCRNVERSRLGRCLGRPLGKAHE